MVVYENYSVCENYDKSKLLHVTASVIAQNPFEMEMAPR